MTIREILKEITKDSTMTQVELAKFLGYATQQAMSAKIVRGNTMNVDELLRILDKFGYKVKIEKWGGKKYEATRPTE